MLAARIAVAALALSLSVSNTGCGSEGEHGDGGAAGPALVPVDSILLPESEAFYLGNPWPPTIDPRDGSIYIADSYSSRVYRFDRKGRLIRAYGRPGSGPGELRGPTLVFMLDDSTLAVRDGRLGRIKRFHRETGEPLGEHVFTAFVGAEPPIRRNGLYWFAGVEQGRPHALLAWDPERDVQTLVGDLPEEYHVSRGGSRPGYANAMLGGSVTWAAGTFVRGWPVQNDLLRYMPEGEVVDTIHLPVVRRRGVPDNLRYMYDVKGALGLERFTVHSKLRQLHTLPDGALVFTHHDQDVESFDGPVPVLSSQSWLGVASPDFSRACVDARVPSSPDVRPMEAFRGDTLFVLDRGIVDGERLETWIRLYRIDTAGCDWLPAG